LAPIANRCRRCLGTATNPASELTASSQDFDHLVVRDRAGLLPKRGDEGAGSAWYLLPGCCTCLGSVPILSGTV
jgi:hypothetical protein